MLQPGRDVDFALEALRAEGVGKLGIEDLECDRTVVPEVLCQVHDRHPAPAELALDPVAI